MKVFQNLKIPLLLGMSIGALAVFFFLYSPPSIAAPTITWTPSKISETISPGVSTMTSVSFTASKNLNNVVVRVVPELEPYLEVNPAAFSSINKGQTYNLDLNIRAPADSLSGAVDGTIQLRSGSGPKKTFAKPLPVTISIEPPGLPPDPGEAGKATLEGIDSDGDGVRDDLQRWIAFNFPNEPAVRAELRQYAIGMQQALPDAESEELAFSHNNKIHRSISCLELFLGLDEAYESYSLLKAQILNTEERSLAYILYDSQLSGHTFPLTEANLNDCNFDPNTM